MTLSEMLHAWRQRRLLLAQVRECRSRLIAHNVQPPAYPRTYR